MISDNIGFLHFFTCIWHDVLIITFLLSTGIRQEWPHILPPPTKTPAHETTILGWVPLGKPALEWHVARWRTSCSSLDSTGYYLCMIVSDLNSACIVANNHHRHTDIAFKMVVMHSIVKLLTRSLTVLGCPRWLGMATMVYMSSQLELSLRTTGDYPL